MAFGNFIDGTLPPAGTTCRQDKPPFPAPEPVGGIATGGGALAGEMPGISPSHPRPA
ncbi:hypothetical protein [Streptomyces sp. NPDC001340]